MDFFGLADELHLHVPRGVLGFFQSRVLCGCRAKPPERSACAQNTLGTASSAPQMFPVSAPPGHLLLKSASTLLGAAINSSTPDEPSETAAGSCQEGLHLSISAPEGLESGFCIALWGWGEGPSFAPLAWGCKRSAPSQRGCTVEGCKWPFFQARVELQSGAGTDEIMRTASKSSPAFIGGLRGPVAKPGETTRPLVCCFPVDNASLCVVRVSS